MDVANDDPAVLVNAAYALTYLGEDIGAMIALIDRALGLNPSFARGRHVSGVVRLWAGQPELAVEHTKIALRLSPRARLGASLNIIGAGHFYCRRFAEAAPVDSPDDPGGSKLPPGVSQSCRLLCAFGAPRRGAGGRPAAEDDRARGDAGPWPFAKRSRSRADCCPLCVWQAVTV
jgi:hypothetical protein